MKRYFKYFYILIFLSVSDKYFGINQNCSNSFNQDSDSSQLVFSVNEALFDFKDTNTLGLHYLNKQETIRIYSPSTQNENNYNHGVVLFAFKDQLYAQWQTSRRDEDSEDTHVLYSISSDGKNWLPPKILVPPHKDGISTSGGWWSYNDTLIAFINYWPNNQNKKKGYVIYKVSSDGLNWSKNKRILAADSNYIYGIFEQDPHLLPSGRIVNGIHEQPGLRLSPFYTDDPRGITGWKKGKMKNLKFVGKTSREIEPSTFYRSDNSIVMVFRDQASSFKQLASISLDNCVTWSTPVITDMPDSRSKQCAGNLPSGRVYLINNPSGSKTRIPLVITFSNDGYLFDEAYLIRAGGEDLQPMKFEGKYKRAGYSYPKSIIWQNYLYVGYATNKEDIEVTRVPLTISN
jgi:hypothetical protein